MEPQNRKRDHFHSQRDQQGLKATSTGGLAVARRVIEEAETGERDPERLRDNVLRGLEDKQRQALFQVP
jgi:hypothetical protein